MSYYIKRTQLSDNTAEYLASEERGLSWMGLGIIGIKGCYSYGELVAFKEYPTELLSIFVDRHEKNSDGKSIYGFSVVQVIEMYSIYVRSRAGSGHVYVNGIHASEGTSFVRLFTEEEIEEEGWKKATLFETAKECLELKPALRLLFPNCELDIKLVSQFGGVRDKI